MKITDQTGRILFFEKTPSKIISVVPSITELLYDLGLREQVIGITKFCIHPEAWFRNKIRVGGTKQLKIDLIKSLAPDLIIANMEENTRSAIETIASFTNVYISKVETIDDAYQMMSDIGEITGRKSEADKIVAGTKSALLELTHDTWNLKPRVLYFIWNKPKMVAGADTFISEMLNQAGFENAASAHIRYPELSDSEIMNMDSDLFFLSSEPFPFKEKHVEEFKRNFPGKKIILADGEMFSWYGSRMKLATDYFRQLRAQLETK
ncbi:MAG TPA: cobalamin-binding protein [Bacteroidetes bacterium]|nr:cobalamin-binding protein [Bacteroidota bacterium]